MIRNHRNHKAIFLFVLFLLPLGSNVGAETTPADLQEELENAIQTGQEVQQKADAWGEEREKLRAQIRDLENRKRWLEHQQGKYEIYLQKQKEKIEQLERNTEKAEEIRMALEPYLEEVVERLEDFIERDLPFLPDERQSRLAFLKDSLDDYHVGLPEKLRRVLEALQVEAEYGKSLEKTETSLQLNGEPIQVYLFRLGRMALFFLSLDQKEAGRLNGETGQWEILPHGYSKDLARAVEIAEKKRIMELVNLPIGEFDE